MYKFKENESLYTTIKETIPPTTATVGIVGQKYLDTTTKKYYICTNIDNSVYTWEELAKSTDLDSKLNTSGGTISGNLAVQGNLTVTGETTTEKQKTLDVEDNFIYTNANKVELTALLSGLAIYKNGTDIYAIAYDPATDSVKLGLGTRDEQGVFHFNTGEGSPVAVRTDSADLTDNHIIVWDATNHKFIDSGKTIADLDNRDIGVELNVPNTATNGTLTESQLQILQSNNSNYIILDHEIYTLKGSGHQAGFLTYNCNEYENSTTYLKFITITISTRGWVLNTTDVQSKLTFDNTPTQNSNNPVTSNGIYNACLSFPSANYVDISSDDKATFVAPANGFVTINGNPSRNGSGLGFYILNPQGDVVYASFVRRYSSDVAITVPIAKGMKAEVKHEGGGTIYYCRFIYATL